MKRFFCSIYLLLIASIVACTNAQQLSENQKDKIVKEIESVFQKSIDVGESIDVEAIRAQVDDRLQAGFIDGGIYFDSFAQVMSGFEERVQGIKSQKIEVHKKRITVLSENLALLTASGKSQANLVDGRTFEGKFAWSFVYSKIEGEWKVIHSHMSNP
jgi:hypothetical protein